MEIMATESKSDGMKIFIDNNSNLAKKTEPCCERMVNFNSNGHIRIASGLDDNNKPTFKGVVLRMNYIEDSYQIDFCPFCGKQIQVIKIEGV
jgi:hypothetical protein